MSEREWGEMAMVVNAANEEKVARYVGSWGHIPESHWVFADGSTLLARQVSLVRPLVVIDPEDREAVERLTQIIYPNANRVVVDDFVAALREFAAPKPPRPEEPTGLGAVVEDSRGRRWVRVEEEGDAAWCPSDRAGSFRCWTDFSAAVRILSPGVEVAQ